MKLLSYLSLTFFSGVLTGFWVFCPESSDAKKKIRNFVISINDIEPDDGENCDIH